jgi:glycyl-tRNA synthetase beta chain
MTSLLIELRTEELPPKILNKLGDSLANGISNGLNVEDFLSPESEVRAFAAPRRIGVLITKVRAVQGDRVIERKGPSLSAGHTQSGEPTPALLGFARSCGVSIEALSTQVDAKGIEAYVYRGSEPGKSLATLLGPLLADVLNKLPVQKIMHWGAHPTAFIRPVHGLIVLHGAQILELEALGHRAGRTTLGHRFLSSGPLTIADADSYEATLQTQGRVIAHFGDRKNTIQKALLDRAGSDTLIAGEDLLDEVTALVEWPVVYEAHFDEGFLQVPPECLTLSMKSHQKYFPLGSPEGVLSSRFLLVSNIETDDPSEIISGNERVLRARLSDARFFYEQDQKRSLESRLSQLEQVVYHNKLGSVGERVRRLERLASVLASLLGADPSLAERAARLCKADLVTDMVGEFPELQGIMGTYYARLDGEAEAVAVALREHYQPRFAKDALPDTLLGAIVALGDKLDTLVGIFGIGQIPTGDKDPFALRRQALGIIRILLEKGLPLSLEEILVATQAGFPDSALEADTLAKVKLFILDRVRHTLKEQGYSSEMIEAVLSRGQDRLDDLPGRLLAVEAFLKLDAAEALAAAHKRIRNILKKTESAPHGPINPSLFEQAAEHALSDAIQELQGPVQDAMANKAYVEALTLLAGVRHAVDTFFKDVMVMADNVEVRDNRLALLAALEALMNQVADLSYLSVN